MPEIGNVQREFLYTKLQCSWSKFRYRTLQAWWWAHG